MVAFIDEHRETYGVEPICGVLPIAPSTYHAQHAREVDPSLLPAREKRDAELRPEVERVWRENQSVYGAQKVWKQLLREKVQVARCTVERLMRAMGLRVPLDRDRSFQTIVITHSDDVITRSSAS